MFPRFLEENKFSLQKPVTLPKTNIARENEWLVDEISFGMTSFQGRTVSFRECILH